MDKAHFNLVSDPWIKVIDLDDQIQTVSLQTLFENAQRYRQLAGEMRAQDFSVMRLLLAILHTVYSRYDASGDSYDWLTMDTDSMQPLSVDPDTDTKTDDLLDTWQAIHERGQFTSVVSQYLNRYAPRFDFFGDQPFDQVTAQQYDQLVPADHRIAKGKGTVDVKQINRRVSESGNSRAIFAPKTEAFKSTLALDELIRWVITYHNFTGVTDKTKVKAPEKFSVSMGWAYRLNPVYAQGSTLFETLMLNLTLVPDDESYHVQRPQWEYSDQLAYVQHVLKQVKPNNVAEIYTMWSRILHIQWGEDGTPIIFSGGLPSPDVNEAFYEPMTVWKWAAKDKPPVFKPARKSTASLGKAMWRNFGQYVAVQHADENSNSFHTPGVVSWLALLKRERLLPKDFPVQLASVTLISDGNATSQAPVAEAYDDMTINAAVLFDDEGATRWPARIEDAVVITQSIGTDFYHFVSDVATIRGIKDSAFASRQSARFYDRLNVPFKDWLAKLQPADNRDEKIEDWKAQLKQLVIDSANEVVQMSNSRDLRGITTEINKKPQYTNVILANKHFRGRVKRHLAQVEGGK